MEKSKAVKILRREINDSHEPFKYTNEELESLIDTACMDYSNYRPLIKRAFINIKKGTDKYTMPEDFQKVISGFENYDYFDFIGRDLYTNIKPKYDFTINYTYYADQTIETIPFRDIVFIMDYCFWSISNSIVIKNSEIESLKIGNNLSVKTNCSRLNETAQKRFKHYNDNVVKSSMHGGWI